MLETWSTLPVFLVCKTIGTQGSCFLKLFFCNTYNLKGLASARNFTGNFTKEGCKILFVLLSFLLYFQNVCFASWGIFCKEKKRVAVLFIHKHSLSTSRAKKSCSFRFFSVFTRWKFHWYINIFENFMSTTLMEQFLYATVHFCVHFNLSFATGRWEIPRMAFVASMCESFFTKLL